MVCAILSCQWSRPVSQPLNPTLFARTLSSHLDLGKSRLETLSWLIIGPVNARTVNLSHLACQCSSAAQVASPRRAPRTAQEPAGQALWLPAPAPPNGAPPGHGRELGNAAQRRRQKALQAYRRRWQIECRLGDSKTRWPQHGGHPHHPARQAQHPAGHHSHWPWPWADALRDSHHGQQANQLTRPRIPRQILVPARLRSAQKVDPPSAR